MTPYKATAVFDELTLPAALRREHSTKAGVGGVIRVIEGRLRLSSADGTPPAELTPDRPGGVAPEQLHRVETLGPMRMQVEFYDREPSF